MARIYNNIPLPTPTKNSVPSTDIRDAIFAGAKLDEEVNSPNTTYEDRFGNLHTTSNGRNISFTAQMVGQAIKANAQLAQQATIFTQTQQAKQDAFNGSLSEQKQRIDYVITNLGLEVIGDYENGPYTITEYNQLIRYDNAYWKLRADVPIGTSTTGTTAASWVNDGPHFVNVGDSDLRQNIADNTTAATGAGALGYALDNAYVYGTAGYKLNQLVDIRDFKDAHAEDGDWSYAIEAAVKYAVDNEIHEVYGKGNFYTARTINIQGMSGSFKISIDKLGITANFPNTATGIFGTATDMIRIGVAGNLNGIDIYIGTLDGAYQSTVSGVLPFGVSASRTPVANGINYFGGGMSSSRITMGYLQNCVVGLLWGQQNSPNGTVFHRIGYVQYNYIGAYIRTAASGNSPIAEANVFDFRFCAQNYICGVWGGHGGQFTTLQNGNYDYNGRHVARLRVSDATGLTAIGGKSGLTLTNGTTTYDFLFRYQYQGYWYVFVASYSTPLNYNSGNAFGWSTSDTISCTTIDGVALKFDTINVAEDNPSVSRVNYFDIFHDYQDDTTSKWKIFVEYASGVYGGNLHLSNISFDTAINPHSHSWYGLGAIAVGGYLSLYNYKDSNTPWLNIAPTSIILGGGKQLITGMSPILGGATVVALASSAGFVDAWTFSNLSDYKLFEEGTHYYVKITSKFNLGSTSFHVIVTSDGCSVFVDFDPHLIGYRIIEVFGTDGVSITGYKLQLRQTAQATMYVTVNIERI